MRAELPGSTAVDEDWPAMLTRAGLPDVVSITSLLDPGVPQGILRRPDAFVLVATTVFHRNARPGDRTADTWVGGPSVT